MRARRGRLVALLAVVLATLPLQAAGAAGTGQLTSPAAGATITEPTPVVIEVTGRGDGFFTADDHVVKVRLADQTGAAVREGTTVVDATCAEGTCHWDSTWTTPALDPATLAPFADGPACNGTYTLQVQVDGGAWAGHAVRVARAPAAPADVGVSPGVRRATVRWGAAPDPDVAGYRLQRRPAGGDWRDVASLGPDARRHTDDAVGAGEVEYRVVTLKGDGQVDGAPAAPCADTERDLATPSAPVATTVPASAPSGASGPQASPSATDAGPGDAGTAGPGDGDGEAAAGDPSEPAAPQAGAEGATPAGRSSSRVAPPPPVQTVRPPGVTVPESSAPDRPAVASEEPSYYGDGEGYSEEIDFGDLDQVAMEEPSSPRTQVVRVPGALQGMLGDEVPLEQVLVPVAAGLILLAIALHLRRWVREGQES